MSTERRTPPRAARSFNKVAVRAAGRRLLPAWAVVEHRGRTSGTPYRTPVAVISTTHHFYIGLPWGRGTDWVRNLRTAGGGTVVWKGRRFAVGDPAFVDKDEALRAANPVERRIIVRSGISDFLRLSRQE